MVVSIVIPTYGRGEKLGATLDALLVSDMSGLDAVEIIVVDDGSPELVAPVVESRVACSPISLRCIRQDNAGPAVARNRGFRESSGDIVLFLDDDVELEPDFVERLIEGYADDPAVTGISGIITNYTPGGFASRMWKRFFVHGPFYDDRQEIYHRADELREAGRIAVSRFGGGLMSFRTDRIGGLRFDRNLQGASEGEDVDFCMHLPKGARLEIDPRARLVHNASVAARKSEHWIASVVRGSSYLYYRNWRSGLTNRVAFFWLMCGFGMFSLAASIKRLSLLPWQAFRKALRYGKTVGLASK